MKASLHGEHPRGPTGFALVTALLVSGVSAALVGAIVLRVTSALKSTERTLALQQAFYHAEAGLDAKLAMLKTNPTDTATIPFPVNSSGFMVTVTPQGQFLRLESTGRVLSSGAGGVAESARSRLRTTVQMGGMGFPILGAITPVTEGSAILKDLSFFEDGDNPRTAVNGCDRASTCLPGLTLAERNPSYSNPNLEPYRYVRNVLIQETRDHGYFGERLRGAKGDRPDFYPTMGSTTVGTSPVPGSSLTASHYSVHKATPSELSLGDGRELSYQWLNELAEWARTTSQSTSNNCYITRVCSPEKSFKGKCDVTVNSSARLGTSGQPKVCMIEYDFETVNVAGQQVPALKNSNDAGFPTNPDILIRGTVRGAGLLVVRGELEVEQGHTFEYDGVVVVIGPSPEVDVEQGTATINGGAIIAASEPWVNCNNNWGNCSGGTWSGPLRRTPIELELSGDGDVAFNFNFAKVQTAGLLARNGGFDPGDGVIGPTVRAWNFCDPANPASCPP
jgi:hypothetical protein